MTRCHVCFRHCELKEGALGFCGARTGSAEGVVCSNYGRISSIALDPIEKKPLRRFMPGSKILSVGSAGCNLRCPFCQNSEISWGDEARDILLSSDEITPERLSDLALKYKAMGNIGVAFTYNEPLTGYEFVRDTARLVKDKGMKNVLVTNGTAAVSVLEEISPYIDAMNIDLKCFDRDTYKSVLGGDLDMTMDFIKGASETSHVEITCLIVPGISDSPEKMRDMSRWIAGISSDIPLHISRFFPRFHMKDASPTPLDTIYALRDIARQDLRYVYTGNC